MAIADNLVQETSTTTGTGNFTTVTQTGGFRTFNTAFGNGATVDVFFYFIQHATAAEWEYGTGHLSAATTLVRDTVLGSSNAGAAVNFAAGTKYLTSDIPAENQLMRLNTGTADYTVIASDFGKVVELTGATARTLTITAAATLGNGFYFYTKNASTAEWTLDGNGSELDGLANYKSYPGEMRLIQCTGAVLNSTVIHPFYLSIAQAASPFTFTKPPGYRLLGGRVGASGGSGGKTNSASLGGGAGGGGGCTDFSIPASAVGATETITIGAAGTSVTVANTDGNSGGNTTFGSHAVAAAYGGGGGGGTGSVQAGGGGGGQTSAGSIPSGAGGNGGNAQGLTGPVGTGSGPATAGFFTGGAGGPNTTPNVGGASTWGGGGGGGGGSTTVTGYSGGNSVYGGAGGSGAAGDTSPVAAAAGTSAYGGNGGQGGADSNGSAGSAGTNGCGGGGGGGSDNGFNSGAGGAGSAAVWGLI